jgi:hypothetical protein
VSVLEPQKPSFWDRVQDSPFLAGETAPVTRAVPTDPRTLLQICWATLAVCPTIALLLAVLDSQANSAPDAIVGVGAIFVPLWLFAVVLAPVVVWRARKTDLTILQRGLHVALGLALLPMCYLMALLYGTLGGRSFEEYDQWSWLCLGLFGVWMTTLWMVKRYF